MNTEATLISAVCKNKDISTLLANNVDELFTSHRDIWESLKSYYYKFKAVPEAGILMERHKDFEPVEAKAETGYNGPFHWKYNPYQTSSSGAEGPMQILLSTARYLNSDNVSRIQLRTDLKYNIRTSMGYLRRLYNRYKSWPIVFGYYNTGYPRVNDYALKVVNHKLNW